MTTELSLVSDCHTSDSDEPDFTLVPQPRASNGWRGIIAPFARRRTRDLRDDETGAVTAEYAIIILAGVAFAGLLVAIMRSNEVREMLVKLVENALGSAAS